MTVAAQINTQSTPKRSRPERVTPERQLVQRIVAALSPARIGIERETAGAIDLSVARDGWMLARITLGRSALARLQSDPAREVKLEYLIRDILRTAPKRARWAYPR